MNCQSHRNQFFALFLFLIVVATGLSLRAQNTTVGAIAGTVTDSTGAVVAGAQITATNQATHQVSVAVTNSSGSYSIENLLDGDYTVGVSKSGFKQISVTDIHLNPGQRRGQNVKLEIGNVEAKVTVEADIIGVQTESAESGGTISAKEVSNLMLNGRNFQQLATLVPGVSSTTGANQQVNAGYLGQTSLIVGGASSEETTYTIDGVYDMTPTSLINVNITPSLDAINEMRVLTNSYSAKYGYAGSGQILIDTKSGTSAFHGSGFEYIRNNGFGVARPYSVSGTPATSSSLHLNIYGFSFGGPLFIPKVYNESRTKTFFFVGAELKTNHYASLLNSRSEFTQAIRNGDESANNKVSGQTCGTTPSSAALAAGCTGAFPADQWLTCDSYCTSLLTARSLTAAQCFFKDANGVTNQIHTNCFDSAAAYSY